MTDESETDAAALRDHVRALSEELRRLRLDNEDLRHECARLKAAIVQNQAEAVALGRRNAVLQRHVDVLHRLTAWRHTRLFRFLLRRLL